MLQFIDTDPSALWTGNIPPSYITNTCACGVDTLFLHVVNAYIIKCTWNAIIIVQSHTIVTQSWLHSSSSSYLTSMLSNETFFLQNWQGSDLSEHTDDVLISPLKICLPHPWLRPLLGQTSSCFCNNMSVQNEKGIFHSTHTWWHTRFTKIFIPPYQTVLLARCSHLDSLPSESQFPSNMPCPCEPVIYLINHAIYRHKNNCLRPSSRTPSCLQDRCMDLHCSICMHVYSKTDSKRVYPLIPSWLYI